jgi:hypothetical protein
MHNLAKKLRKGRQEWKMAYIDLNLLFFLKTLQLKQGYHQNFNISLFNITFVKTFYNVDIDHLFFLSRFASKIIFFKKFGSSRML